MDFFKSILSDDPDPNSQQDSSPPKQSHIDRDPNSAKPNSTTAADGADGGVWSFGGLFKTFSSRSESVLDTYRRDLQEFGYGLKKETELFREVASRAVKELPNSLEVGNTVSHAFDAVKDTLLASSDVEPEPETPDTNRSLNSGRYSRFESQLMSIQSDRNMFCVDPEDLEEYKKWKAEFDLKEKKKEIDCLNGENGSLEGMYKRVVPNEVDNETFWCRYFYQVFKLKQKESVRANLVKRAISIDNEEELSWDVDDDDDNEQESNVKSKVDEQGKKGSDIGSKINEVKKLASDENESVNQDSTNAAKEVPAVKSEPRYQVAAHLAEEVPTNKSEPSKKDSTNVVKKTTHSDESQSLSSAAVDQKEENQANVDGSGKNLVVESSGNSKDSKKGDTEVTSLDKKEEGVVKGSEGKGDGDESRKDGDVPVASSQKTGTDEDDLDWAEIEDVEGNDDKKATSHVASSSNRADLRKRLSVEEDNEDLSWD
ncbi:unnamed protein product [Withania somnifera]